MTDLRRHIPRIALEWDRDAPGRAWQQVDATLVFADISGFTALTEKLARRGRIGAEELIETLNRIFGGMLGQAGLRGGELLKFGGDALLFVFRGDGHAERACAAAVEMRISLRQSAKIPTSVGRLKLSMSIGVHSGPVDFFLVGAPTRELLILGTAATQTAEAEHAAVAGEILVSPDTARRLPASATAPRAADDLRLLRWRVAPTPPGLPAEMPEVSDEQLRTLFPTALGEYLAERVPDPEHKVATIAFARFSGTDSLLTSAGHDAVAEALHGTLSVFEDAMIAEGVTLLATDLDSDGGKLFMASGVPFSSEDDEGRMLRAMRHVLDVGTPLPLQIGVNRGHVFAAEVGALSRSAYSAMGDTTNTAARIMSKAGPGVLFAHPAVLEQSRTLFATQPAGPFAMKGKAVPVLVFDVGEEQGTRGVGGDTSSLPLVGREEEVRVLRSAFDEAFSGAGGVITITAPTGFGKSRLVTEALEGFDATRVVVRAEPYGMTNPYRMLRDPVRQAFGVRRADPQVMSRRLLASFARLMPDQLPFAPLLEDVVSIPIPSTPEASAIEPRFRRDRIAELILELTAVTVPGPLVLLVEDAHWADTASVTVLRRLADAAAGRPWAVVVTRRSEGEGFDPSQGTRIELGPLPDPVMRRIVIDLTEATPLRPHEVDGIVARAEGSPLYVAELVRVFREVGSLDAMPQNLHAALDAQIDALDPHSRRILRYASVLGRSFRREVLDETLRGDELIVDEATLAKLSEFLEADGPERLRFRNSMIRDAAYDGLAYRLRTKLHQAAGRAVEALSDDHEADADTLSLHFWRGGDDARTWRYARIAGDHAADAYANVDAASQYERALEAGRRMADVSDVQLRALWQRLGEVRDLAGLYSDAIEAMAKALSLSRDDPIATADVLLKRARTRISLGGHTTAMRDVSRGERLLAGDASLDARRRRVRFAVLRALVRQDQQKFSEALAQAQALEAEARATEEVDALESALMISDGMAFQLGDFSVGDRTREAIRLAVANGRLARASAAATNLGVFSFYAGRWDDAVTQYLDGRSTAFAAGDVVGAAQVGVSLGELYVNRGQLDEADEVLADSVRLLRTAGQHSQAAYGAIHQARALLARGHLTEADQLAADVEVELASSGRRVDALEAALVRAEALTAQGRPDEALSLLQVSSESAGGEAIGLMPRIHLERARAVLASGDSSTAADEARTGLAMAQEYGLAYEEARLLLLTADIESARGDAESMHVAAERASALLKDLGILSSASA